MFAFAALAAHALAGAARAQLAATPPVHARESAAMLEDTGGPKDELFLGAGFSAGVLDLPRFGAGASVYTQVAPRRFIPIELSGTYFFNNTAALSRDALDLDLHPLYVVPFPSGEPSRLVFQLTEVAGALCPFSGALEGGKLFVCGGAYGAMMRVRAERFVRRDDREWQALFGLEAYVRFRFPLPGPFAITYRLGVQVPLRRDRFGHVGRYGEFEELFRTSYLVGRADVLLVVGL